MANNKLQRKSEKEVAKKSHPHSLVETTKKALGRETKNASFWEMQLEKAALEMTVKVSQKQRVENYALCTSGGDDRGGNFLVFSLWFRGNFFG